MGNYRPVCLQDTLYKVLSAILTGCLYLLAEQNRLLDLIPLRRASADST